MVSLQFLFVLAATIIQNTATGFRHGRFALPISKRSIQETFLGASTGGSNADSVVVIKYGGHAMENDELKEMFCRDVADLYKSGFRPVIVHGGGPQIAKMLKSLNVESKFLDGLRVTDEATMEVAQMVLCGSINKDICQRISKHGVDAVGLSGLDSQLIKAKQKNKELGLVGEPVEVNADFLKKIINIGCIPVIAPIGTMLNEDGTTGGSLNINADTSAGAVAEALKAAKFLLLTDIVGVLDKEKKLIEKIPSSQFRSLKEDGTIFGGMIPKLETAVQAVLAGVGAVSIMDGRVEHCVLKAVQGGEAMGTLIVKE